MSDLQPTPIIDKNGVHTVRNKKRLDVASTRSLPKPVASNIAKTPAKNSKVYSTLDDIYRAVGLRDSTEPTPLIAVHGADSSIPEGYLSATVRLLGVTGTYILKESPNQFGEAVVIGRVEYNVPFEKSSGNVYKGGNIKGGTYASSFTGMDEAVQTMIRNHEEDNPDGVSVITEDDSAPKTLGSLIRLADKSMTYYPSDQDLPEGFQVVKAQIRGEERGYILKASESDDVNDAEIIGYIEYSAYTGLGNVYRGKGFSDGQRVQGIQSDKEAVEVLLADIEHNNP